ncbi:deoxyribose-phosphate aldolase [Catenibacillus scindens]|uniref:Deoxyribose-phosphate aldolase n=1 Tax=Catenibacillus scindens TaxID=673271 RepID=A0A7W8H7C4_9FIRM|nr:deoxyribose-phosphate aldolase [Catenibacillus scindens]MBB5263234.1 deoxyribose-phosphate aldolase [Catenibacillus scindens]
MLSPKLFDHTILKADAREEDVARVCREAVEYGFASVCVNSFYTPLAASLLKDTDVKVCTVVGFPLGMAAGKVKCFEARWAVEEGAGEIDMVINVGAIKDRKDGEVREEIAQVKAACKDRALLKVIIETCLLTEEEKVRACRLAVEAGADFVKTSTGFSTGGARVEDVALMSRTVGDKAGVKASGGIRDAKTAQAMVDAGASRLGTSATVSIITES